jgi:hypothetical protein
LARDGRDQHCVASQPLAKLEIASTLCEKRPLLAGFFVRFRIVARLQKNGNSGENLPKVLQPKPQKLPCWETSPEDEFRSELNRTSGSVFRSLPQPEYAKISMSAKRPETGIWRPNAPALAIQRPFRDSPESGKDHRPPVRSVLEIKPASPSRDRCERDAAQESSRTR